MSFGMSLYEREAESFIIGWSYFVTIHNVSTKIFISHLAGQDISWIKRAPAKLMRKLHGLCAPSVTPSERLRLITIISNGIDIRRLGINFVPRRIFSAAGYNTSSALFLAAGEASFGHGIKWPRCTYNAFAYRHFPSGRKRRNVHISHGRPMARFILMMMMTLHLLASTKMLAILESRTLDDYIIEFPDNLIISNISHNGMRYDFTRYGQRLP